MRLRILIFTLTFIGLTALMPDIALAQDTPEQPLAPAPYTTEDVPKPSSKMNSRKYYVEPKPKAQEPETATKDKAAEEETGEDASAARKAKDPEEKIWENYRKIAGGAKKAKADEEVAAAQDKKGKVDKKETDEESEDDSSASAKDDEKDDEKEKAEKPAPPTGIAGILEGYVNRQTKAPKMGTRSFANPEDRQKADDTPEEEEKNETPTDEAEKDKEEKKK